MKKRLSYFITTFEVLLIFAFAVSLLVTLLAAILVASFSEGTLILFGMPDWTNIWELINQFIRGLLSFASKEEYKKIMETLTLSFRQGGFYQWSALVTLLTLLLYLCRVTAFYRKLTSKDPQVLSESKQYLFLYICLIVTLATYDIVRNTIELQLISSRLYCLIIFLIGIGLFRRYKMKKPDDAVMYSCKVTLAFFAAFSSYKPIGFLMTCMFLTPNLLTLHAVRQIGIEAFKKEMPQTLGALYEYLVFSQLYQLSSLVLASSITILFSLSLFSSLCSLFKIEIGTLEAQKE